jgi:hypothetical protein
MGTPVSRFGHENPIDVSRLRQSIARFSLRELRLATTGAMHFRYESRRTFTFPPFAAAPVAPGSRPWEQSGPVLIDESPANFAMNFHPRGAE